VFLYRFKKVFDIKSRKFNTVGNCIIKAQQSTDPSDLRLNILLDLLSSIHTIFKKYFHVNPRVMRKDSSLVTSIIATARFSRFSQGLRFCVDLHRCALNNSALILTKLKKKQVTNGYIMQNLKTRDSKLVSI